MKRFYCFFILCLLSVSLYLNAQDARQRTVRTIVLDALAQLPCQTKEESDTLFDELAKAGEQVVEELGNMLVPTNEEINSKIEYAINGLVIYSTAIGNQHYLPSINEGLKKAVEKCSFIRGKAFLMTQLQYCCDKNDIPFFTTCLQDSLLAPYAINSLIYIKGSEDSIMKMVSTQAAPRYMLAYAVKEKGIAGAEPYLLSWLKNETLQEVKNMIYSALAVCGTVKSMDILEKESMYDYVNLLKHLIGSCEDKLILKRASKLLRYSESEIRSSAMSVILSIKGTEARKEIYEALKDKDIEYRNSVLKMATLYADEGLYDWVADIFPTLSEEAKVDVVRWLGNNKVVSQVPLIINVYGENDKLSCASIEAAGKIPDERVSDFLIAQLSGKHQKEAYKALLSYQGNIVDGLCSVFSLGTDSAILNAMNIASARRIKQVSKSVFQLLYSENKEISDAAYRNLYGVVTKDNIKTLVHLLNDEAEESKIVYLQKALLASISYLTQDEQYHLVSSLIASSEKPELYYTALASIGTDASALLLVSEFKKEKHALLALDNLLKVNNIIIADALLDAANLYSEQSEKIILHYINIIQDSSLSMLEKCDRYQYLLTRKHSSVVGLRILRALSAVPTSEALLLSSQFLDESGYSYEAACTVKNIVGNMTDIVGYEVLEPIIKKTISIYEASGKADDGYAIDELNKLLEKLKPEPRYFLSAEEKREGFEILYDGTDLSNWVGDTIGYKSTNGAIHVSAKYGNAKNLYTKKEYKNFILRFDFSFLVPGINNGVGIRTPMGVDAAYYGMCEIQILDHDAPIYKGLANYQVHGSVYGIIPAKRIKHKPFGEWSTEEIRVEGDHIVVTVNGEEILNGNIREACQGHNVSPKKGTPNPYTADHRDHPGMFNEKGHVGFLGHGEGLKLKNIRILDLDK